MLSARTGMSYLSLFTFTIRTISFRMSDLVRFFSFINNAFFRLQVSRDSTLSEFYENVVITNSRIADHIPLNVSAYSCKFYLLKNPVPLPGPNTNEELEIRRKSCVDNRIEVSPETTYVRDLGKNFSAESVMLVIDVPLAHRKRPHGESSIDKRIKSAKINEYRPSNIGSAEYRMVQENHEWRVLDGRRVVGDVGDTLDDSVPPISLLYQPFGEFLDTYRGYSGNHGPGEGISTLMKQKVDQFATMAAMIYRTEEDRSKTCLHHLDEIFSTVLGTDHRPFVAGSDSPQTDGHSTAPGGEPICIGVFKNESVAINSIPTAQLLRYYIQLIQVAKAYPDVLESSRMPALGITVVGPVITFYAIICLRGEFRYTSLTPGLSCVHNATGGEDRQGLYRAFTAACTFLRQVTQSAMSSELLTPPIDVFYPDITELPLASVGLPKTIQFTIDRPHIRVVPGRYIYHATCSNGSELIIKFTSRYSVDLHNHCAAQGHAPKLRGFARLPGGLYGVAMDFVYGHRWMNKSDPLDDRRKWARQLKELIGSFHALGYVHGDLQLPNILIADGEVMLIDFDWGGQEGKVAYPHGPLARELTVGRNQDDPKITKHDDERVLQLTLWEIDLWEIDSGVDK